MGGPVTTFVVRCNVDGHRQAIGTIELGPDGIELVRKAPIDGVQTGNKPLWLHRRSHLTHTELSQEPDSVVEFYCPRHGIGEKAFSEIQRAIREVR